MAYATTVGVKGHGVGVGRPLGIEVQILGAVGGDVRHWVAAEFRLLIPSCEGITGFEGDRQGCPRYERKLRECTAVATLAAEATRRPLAPNTFSPTVLL